MREILPEHARISDPDEHQLLQRVPEQPGDQSNPNKKRKSLTSDGSGTAQRRSEPPQAPGAPRATLGTSSGRRASATGGSVSWQEHLCRSVKAVAGTGIDASEGTTSRNSAEAQNPLGLCEEGERIVRAERARRTLETLYSLKRRTPADAKKGRKK